MAERVLYVNPDIVSLVLEPHIERPQFAGVADSEKAHVLFPRLPFFVRRSQILADSARSIGLRAKDA